MGKRKESEGCALDMTPMIDVVFQLMIFFIVTITMSEAKDETIRLELGPNGQEVESSSELPTAALVIDVSEKGRVSMGNLNISDAQLRNIMRNRMKRSGPTFQVWVRGDARAQHAHIRRVMDICTAEGIGRVHFIAVKDVRTDNMRKFIKERGNKRY